MEWSVPVDTTVVLDLESSLVTGPMNEDGTYRLDEVAVGHINGLKVEIFSNEHPPPHFRVSFQGESNTFEICSGTPMHGNTLKKYHRNIKDWHRKHRNYFVERWNKLRPSNCPVGEVKC